MNKPLNNDLDELAQKKNNQSLIPQPRQVCYTESSNGVVYVCCNDDDGGNKQCTGIALRTAKESK
ncbi:hypothetical protein ACJROX_13275 [Pseudalkalibacillus sp. A8]|uniref:hypothetical protein n=1 Tax=Pseudalkalibacillus sp. A8 TaxID=3382641 RepID=UPI0038B4C87D